MSWMKTSTVLLVLILAVVMMTAGCTQTPTTTPTTTAATTAVTPLPTTVIVTMAPPAGNATGNATGMANPASVYCVQVGGNLSIKKDAQGNEYGVCNFPNGTSVDEWALFRGETNLTATNSTAKMAAGNMTTNATKNMTTNMTAAKGAVNKTNST